MTILCCDPGFSHYGCAVFDTTGKPIKLGTLTTEASKTKMARISDDKAYRIAQLTTQLSNVIQQNKIQAVLGEMPGAGGQSARAIQAMAIATAVSVAVFTMFRLPVEWTTPVEVKKALTGNKSASKIEMMEAACKRYGWRIEKKEVRSKKSGAVDIVKRVYNVYYPLNQKTSASTFEHVADSLGVYEALKHCNIARMFIK